MFSFDFNGQREPVLSTAHMARLLEHFDQSPQFELWANSPAGASLCMLRNGDDAWLMYLRHEGDSGFSSRSASDRSGSARFKLSNGQYDAYPLSWCVDVEQGYLALAYFCKKAGARSE